jgi:NitT/TauT family transport system permease protein
MSLTAITAFKPVVSRLHRFGPNLSWSNLSSPLVGFTRRTGAVLLFFAAWEILPRSGAVDEVFLPPFSHVAAAFWKMLLSGSLEQNTLASLTRALAGLGLAILVAIPAGFIIGSNRRIAQMLDPLLEIFRNTAPLALLPVFSLTLGIGETSKIAMVFYAASWPILLSTVSAVRTVDPAFISVARTMGFGRIGQFRKVVLPASVPAILTGVRMAAALSLLVLIAAEMVGAKAGLGYLVNATQFNFQIPEMYAGILTLSLLGVLFNSILLAIENRFSGWKRG